MAFALTVSVFGFYFYPLAAAAILFSFFEPPKKMSGIFAVFITGFFWDIYSAGFLMFRTLALFLTALLLKSFSKKYLETPVFFK
jgi:cell shape-determining protein MreD